jgi:predicted ABC-type ATPase
VTKPSFTVVAGPNGSGKSTITRWNRELLAQIPVIDPDAIARTIQVNSKAASPLAAGREALSRVAAHLDAGQSFAVETTLSGHNYLQLMVEARERGFDVALIYVGTSDPSINVARVANRVALGGHDVPEIDIRRRYERSLLNLPTAVSRADHSILFDNSTDDGFQLIAYFDHGKGQWFQQAPAWATSLVSVSS